MSTRLFQFFFGFYEVFQMEENTHRLSVLPPLETKDNYWEIDVFCNPLIPKFRMQVEQDLMVEQLIEKISEKIEQKCGQRISVLSLQIIVQNAVKTLPIGVAINSVIHNKQFVYVEFPGVWI